MVSGRISRRGGEMQWIADCQLEERQSAIPRSFNRQLAIGNLPAPATNRRDTLRADARLRIICWRNRTRISISGLPRRDRRRIGNEADGKDAVYNGNVWCMRAPRRVATDGRESAACGGGDVGFPDIRVDFGGGVDCRAVLFSFEGSGGCAAAGGDSGCSNSAGAGGRAGPCASSGGYAVRAGACAGGAIGIGRVAASAAAHTGVQDR